MSVQTAPVRTYSTLNKELDKLLDAHTRAEVLLKRCGSRNSKRRYIAQKSVDYLANKIRIVTEEMAVHVRRFRNAEHT